MFKLEEQMQIESEILLNCENYLSKMFNRPKLQQKRDKSRTEQRSRSVSRKTDAVQVQQSSQARELLHREIINNNLATVEVTVRALAQKSNFKSKPNPSTAAIVADGSNESPWSKLLKHRKSTENLQNVPGTFGNFDPLRTLHFLTKELQLKLQSICPSDVNVQQILIDMQNAVLRLPPELNAKSGETTHRSRRKDSCCTSDIVPNKLTTSVGIQTLALEKKSSFVQTQQQPAMADEELVRKMQVQLEASAMKLEQTCLEMEATCNQLRKERDEYAAQFANEQQTVKMLQQKFHDANTVKDDEHAKDLINLISERDALLEQMRNLQRDLNVAQSQLSDQRVINNCGDEVRTQIADLRHMHDEIQQENHVLHNELTLIKLERDKKQVLLESRDKQLQELRNELECIQRLVSTQLLELKNKPPLSPATSFTSVSQIWNQHTTTAVRNVCQEDCNKVNKMRKKLKQKTFNTDYHYNSPSDGKSVRELYVNTDAVNKNKQSGGDVTSTTTSNYDTYYQQDVPEREDSVIYSEREREQRCAAKTIRTNIKDMFAEMKRQAFLNVDVKLPTPTNIFN